MEFISVDYNSIKAPSFFSSSIHQTGFAIIHNHDLSDDLIREVYSEWEKFFNMTEAYKSNFLFQRDYKVVQDGFFPILTSEKAKGYDQKDIKEFYHFCPAGRIPVEINSTQILYKKLLSLASTLLSWLSEDLDANTISSLQQPLQNMVDSEYQTILRAIHYPPLPENLPEGSMRAAPHEDINFITLLVAATAPGLEVQSRDGSWYSVMPEKNDIIVNVGDMLEEATNGYYKSTTHRVINPKGNEAKKSRYSIPLFVHPKAEAQLSSRYTAKQYLDERLQELGLLQKLT